MATILRVCIQFVTPYIYTLIQHMRSVCLRFIQVEQTKRENVSVQLLWLESSGRDSSISAFAYCSSSDFCIKKDSLSFPVFAPFGQDHFDQTTPEWTVFSTKSL